MRERLRLAVPNKGRLVEPTLALLHDAGLVFEEHDRSLVARVQNHPLDILFVRTGDVIEFVADGVAEMGITGIDILAESGADLLRLRDLGYGRCRLAAAVPSDSPFQAIEDLGGVRVATSHPNIARRFFATQGIPVEVVPLSGAVEVAPRLGLADAIVDLVSTGSTLAMNGLRPLGDILASEAIVIANPEAARERPGELESIVTMIGSVIAARSRKYLMMNAPAAKLTQLEALLPGLESPSVIPLAHAGMIAIHSVVGADEVWGLLPRLKDAGASGILVLPIEKILAVTGLDTSPVTTTAGFQLQRLDLRDPDAAALRARDALFRRGAVPDPAIRQAARTILTDVRARGGQAVRDAAARFGGGRPDGRLLLEHRELVAARDALGHDARLALETAIDHVERFATAQRPAASRRIEIVPGVELERRWLPLSRAGAYVPGGSAPYPSSLVMTVIPARVAGVGSMVVATPAASDGEIHPVLLGAAGLLDVDAVLVAGGVQAIGALAYGLPDVPLDPVDLIVGPGSAWVTAAKVEVVGDVAIDLPAGPSEGLVLADSTADPVTVAADLITQAEHGIDSPALLVTPDPALADAVEAEVGRRLATAARRDILARALADHGRVVLVADLAAGIEFVNGYGPEHLSVDVADPEAAVARLRNAGSIFLGRWSPESAGDYASGANHVLPTGGLARACGPLAVETFGKFNQVQRITREGLATLRPAIRTLAEAEGLLAHRDAVEARFAPRPPAADDAPSSVPEPGPTSRSPR